MASSYLKIKLMLSYLNIKRTLYGTILEERNRHHSILLKNKKDKTWYQT